MTSQRRRSWGVVIAAVLALALFPLVAMRSSAQAAPGGNGNGNGPPTTSTKPGNGPPTTSTRPGNGGGGNPHNTTTTVCSYPSNNCSTTSTSGGPHPVIVLDLTVAVPGQVVRVTVCGYAPGTVVKLTLDGVVVGQLVVGTEPPKTCTTQNAGIFVPAVVGPLGRVFRVQAQATTSGADGSFTVPSDEQPGSKLVCAEAPGMDTPCARLNVQNGASVLGTTFSQGGAPLLSSSNGDSFLAFTGTGLLRLLLLAGVLLVSGIVLVRRSQPHRA